MPRHYRNWDQQYARDCEKEPTYTGRPSRPYRNPTEQREQSAEDIALKFGRSFVTTEGDS